MATWVRPLCPSRLLRRSTLTAHEVIQWSSTHERAPPSTALPPAALRTWAVRAARSATKAWMAWTQSEREIIATFTILGRLMRARRLLVAWNAYRAASTRASHHRKIENGQRYLEHLSKGDALARWRRGNSMPAEPKSERVAAERVAAQKLQSLERKTILEA